MSTSETSTDNEEIEFKHIVNATVLITSEANSNPLIKKWVEAHDLTCAVCVAYYKGYISNITPIGEKAVRESFAVMADALKVSSNRLVDIAYDVDEEVEL